MPVGDRWWPQFPARACLCGLGNCHHSLGDYRQAIDLHTQALAIARDIGDRYGEAYAVATSTGPG